MEFVVGGLVVTVQQAPSEWTVAAAAAAAAGAAAAPSAAATGFPVLPFSDMLGVSPRFLREASEIYGCRNDAAPRWIMEHGKVTVFPRRGEWGGYRGPRWHHR